MKASSKTQSHKARFISITLLALLIACGGATDPEGGGESEQEAGVPNMAGNWTGTYDGSEVTMSLSQSGRDVSGVLGFRATQYDILGTINSIDRLDFANELDTVNCTLYASFRGMGLSSGGGTMEGDVDRVQLDIPCSEPNPTVRSDFRDRMVLTRD